MQQCVPAPSWAFLPSWAARPELESVFVGAVSTKGFPCSVLPQLTTAFSMGVPGGCRWAVSDRTPWTFGHQQGFCSQCMDRPFCVPVACRAGCPGAGGSLGMAPLCLCQRGAHSVGVQGDLALGGTQGLCSISRTPCSVLPSPSCLNFHQPISSCSRANIIW